MQRHRAMWGMFGDGFLTEVRVLGIWFYSRTEFQLWSPLMHEVTQRRGIRIGHVSIGWSRTVRRFKDGKEPQIIKGGI